MRSGQKRHFLTWTQGHFHHKNHYELFRHILYGYLKGILDDLCCLLRDYSEIPRDFFKGSHGRSLSLAMLLLLFRSQGLLGKSLGGNSQKMCEIEHFRPYTDPGSYSYALNSIWVRKQFLFSSVREEVLIELILHSFTGKIARALNSWTGLKLISCSACSGFEALPFKFSFKLDQSGFSTSIRLEIVNLWTQC